MPDTKTDLKVRLDADLKRAFQSACRSRDLNASQVLRRFMRVYVSECAEGQQSTLFEPAPTQ